MNRQIVVNSRLRTVKPGLEIKTVAESLQGKGYNVQIPTCKPPSLRTMQKWIMDGVAKATDGCRVEPDGTCCHGHKSWLIVLQVI